MSHLRIPLCPARPDNGRPCLQPLPCLEHEIDNAIAGGLIWGDYFYFEEDH